MRTDPTPWPVVLAGSVARIEIGGTPSRNNPAFWADGEAGHPWLSIADLNDKWVFETAERITDAGVRNSNVKPVPMGTPVMSFKLTIGRVALAGRNLFTNEAIAAFHVDPSAVDRAWLYHALPRATRALVTDTAVKGITLNKGRLLTLPLDLPPLDEQARIAAILDTLDEAIRRTEQVIAKLQQMKQGLLHDLLTRGVDENGDLRPLPDEAPHLYKGSRGGRIPREWEATELAKVGTWMSGGTPSKSNPKFWGGSTPWVSPKDMKRFLLEDTEDHLTTLGASAGTRLAPRGAVLIVVRGMILAHTFPVCLIQREMAFNQDLKAITPRPGVTGGFLAYWMVGHEDSLLRLVTEATHGTKRIDLQDLLAYPVALPTPDEIPRIEMRLASADAELRLTVEEGTKLRALKQGLLHDLLTGRVRTPTEHEEH